MATQMLIFNPGSYTVVVPPRVMAALDGLSQLEHDGLVGQLMGAVAELDGGTAVQTVTIGGRQLRFRIDHEARTLDVVGWA